jgi:hypothetical protein
MQELQTVGDKLAKLITVLTPPLDNPMDTLIVRNILACYSKTYEEDPECSDEPTLRDLTTLLPVVEAATWRPVLGCIRTGERPVESILRAAYDQFNDDDEGVAGEYFLS